MFDLVSWPLLIGVAPLAVPIMFQLVVVGVRILSSAHWIRSRRPPSKDGPNWRTGPSGRIRIDGAEGKRHRPVRSRLPSR